MASLIPLSYPFRLSNPAVRRPPAFKPAATAADNVANESAQETSEFPMQLESRLCSRARFWVSLRLDDQLSELEGALLDAHLAGCAACGSFAGESTLTTDELRAAPAAEHAPVRIDVPRRPRRPLVIAFAAAVIAAAAVAGGVVRDVLAPAPESAPARPVAVVASSVELNDQFRQLRRTSLLGQRPIPRDLAV